MTISLKQPALFALLLTLVAFLLLDRKESGITQNSPVAKPVKPAPTVSQRPPMVRRTGHGTNRATNRETVIDTTALDQEARDAGHKAYAQVKSFFGDADYRPLNERIQERHGKK